MAKLVEQEINWVVPHNARKYLQNMVGPKGALLDQHRLTKNHNIIYKINIEQTHGGKSQRMTVQ